MGCATHGPAGARIRSRARIHPGAVIHTRARIHRGSVIHTRARILSSSNGRVGSKQRACKYSTVLNLRRAGETTRLLWLSCKSGTGILGITTIWMDWARGRMEYLRRARNDCTLFDSRGAGKATWLWWVYSKSGRLWSVWGLISSGLWWIQIDLRSCVWLWSA